MDTQHDCFVVCPYCGHQHSDAWEIVKDESPREYECAKCEREFTCWAVETVTYHAEAIEETECSEPQIYRVAGQLKAVKLWAQARGIAWRKVRPVLKPHDCYGLPDGERLIVTGPAATWIDEIVDDAIQHRLKIEWQPTIPEC